jgi:hypothetical protein
MDIKLMILLVWDELKRWLRPGVDHFNQTIQEKDEIMVYDPSDSLIAISRAGRPFDRTEIMLDEQQPRQFLIRRQSANAAEGLRNEYEVVTVDFADGKPVLTFRGKKYTCVEFAEAILKLATGQPIPTPRLFSA